MGKHDVSRDISPSSGLKSKLGKKAVEKGRKLISLPRDSAGLLALLDEDGSDMIARSFGLSRN
jgi:hypothetical protein